MAVLKRSFVRSLYVTNHGSMRLSPIQDYSLSCRSSKTIQIRRKFLVEKSHRNKWSPVSSAKLVMWWLFHFSDIVRSIVSVIPKIRKTNKWRRIIVHHGNASSHTSVKIIAFFTGQNVCHPPYTSYLGHNGFFIFHTSRKKQVVGDYCQTQFFAKLIFWSHCKQHKWLSYVRTFWVRLC